MRDMHCKGMKLEREKRDIERQRERETKIKTHTLSILCVNARNEIYEETWNEEKRKRENERDEDKETDRIHI